MKINKWTITDTTQHNEWGSKEFLCICECGHEQYQQLSTIVNNRSKGCMKCRRAPLKEKYGQWTVIKEAGFNKHKHMVYEVKCDCGFTKVVRKWSLMSGTTTKCVSCAFKENSKRAFRHGLSGTRTYKAWADMKSRCLNQAHPAYHRYGARGIKIFERWVNFDCFLNDMGKVPDGLQLGRKDVNKDYTPDNTIWTTAIENMRNRSNCRQPKLS